MRHPLRRTTICVFAFSVWSMFACGCASRNTIRPVTTAPSDQLSIATANLIVDAYVVPPIGWRLDDPKSSDAHGHQTWISPTGRTAYGVIHFQLPLPVGHDLALWGFLQQMKRTEGEATLEEKRWDENLPGVRFVAVGGLYRVRTNLFVHGWEGWAVYAGTLRKETLMQEELDLAERARDHTAVGLSEGDARGARP